MPHVSEGAAHLDRHADEGGEVVSPSEELWVRIIDQLECRRISLSIKQAGQGRGVERNTSTSTVCTPTRSGQLTPPPKSTAARRVTRKGGEGGAVGTETDGGVVDVPSSGVEAGGLDLAAGGEDIAEIVPGAEAAPGGPRLWSSAASVQRRNQR